MKKPSDQTLEADKPATPVALSPDESARLLGFLLQHYWSVDGLAEFTKTFASFKTLFDALREKLRALPDERHYEAHSLLVKLGHSCDRNAKKALELLRSEEEARTQHARAEWIYPPIFILDKEGTALSHDEVWKEAYSELAFLWVSEGGLELLEYLVKGFPWDIELKELRYFGLSLSEKRRRF